MAEIPAGSAGHPRLGLEATLRRILGMPDYRGYLAELRQRNPDGPVPTEAEYFAAFLQARYERPPIRCC